MRRRRPHPVEHLEDRTTHHLSGTALDAALARIARATAPAWPAPDVTSDATAEEPLPGDAYGARIPPERTPQDPPTG